MAHFIKTGYWESSSVGYKGWLNVEDVVNGIITNVIPSQSGNGGKFLTTDGVTTSWESVNTLYTADGSLTGNRTVTMGSYTLSFEKDLLVNGVTVGAGSGTQAVRFGQNANPNNTSYSVAVGYYALSVSTGNNNTAVGHRASISNTTGVNNTVIGRSALYSNTTGSYNVAIGVQTGFYINGGSHNTLIGGFNTGFSISSGSYNTIIGSQVTGLSAALSNNIILADGQGNKRLVFNDLGQGVAGGSAYPTFVTGIQFDIVGKARATSLRLTSLPTSSAGLVSGDLWNDAGTVKIIP